MRRLERWTLVLIGWGALAFGGVYPWGYWSLAAGSFVIAAWVFAWTHARHDRTVWRTAAGFAGVGMTLALQTMPMPRSVVAMVSPRVDRVLRELDVQYVLQPPDWLPLSLAPASTRVALVLFLAFSALFVALNYAMARVALDRFIVRLTGFGAALAVFAVMQRAANVRSADNDHWQLVYGLWKPLQAGDVFGPFINRNHFAGWMVMTIPLAIGYSCALLETSGLSVRDGWRRWLRWMMRPEASRFMTIALAVAAMGAALTASGSRSGMASFAVATAVMAYFVGQRLGRRRLRILAVGYLVVLLVGAVGWAGAGQAADRFALASADAGGRLGAWRDTLRIIRDFPVAGTGVGAYGRAMLVYQTENRDMFYAHAHNEYLQLAAEGGLLVGLPVAAGMWFMMRRLRERLRSVSQSALDWWVRTGAIAALAGIATQSTVDFSLQLAGNTVLLVVVAAIALHPSLAQRTTSRRQVITHATRV